ncbi:hypothetical protein H4Q26_010689 [Puccinia striiformis f. sp. tritici PST-130]|nr:hypothetical protein H4Q26_010689 [Puccinia striiformis f. sp. tritici PST-130]
MSVRSHAASFGREEETHVGMFIRVSSVHEATVEIRISVGGVRGVEFIAEFAEYTTDASRRLQVVHRGDLKASHACRGLYVPHSVNPEAPRRRLARNGSEAAWGCLQGDFEAYEKPMWFSRRLENHLPNALEAPRGRL